MKRGIILLIVFLLISTSPSSAQETAESDLPGSVMVSEGDVFSYKVEKLFSKVFDGESYVTNTVEYNDEVTLYEGDEINLIIASSQPEYLGPIGWAIKTEWEVPSGSFKYRLIPVEFYGLISHTNWSHIENIFEQTSLNNTFNVYEYEIMDESDTFGYTEIIQSGNDTHYLDQKVEAVYDRDIGNAKYFNFRKIFKIPGIFDIETHTIYRLKGYGDFKIPLSFIPPFGSSCLILIYLKKRG